MKTSKSHIEGMHAKLDDVSSKEQLLIAALGEALSEADRRLLDDVRALTVEHETRRALILTELQGLAARIGAFPASAETQPPAIEQGHLDLPFYEVGDVPAPLGPESDESAATSDETANGYDFAAHEPRGADWRQAARNIRDELHFHMNGKKAGA